MIKMYLDFTALSYKENIDFSSILGLKTHSLQKIGDLWHGKTKLDYSQWSYNSPLFENTNIDFVLRDFMNKVLAKKDILQKTIKESESEVSVYVVIEKDKDDSLKFKIARDVIEFYESINASLSLDGLIDEVFDINDDSAKKMPAMSLALTFETKEPIKLSASNIGDFQINEGKEDNKYWYKISKRKIGCIDTDNLVTSFYKEIKESESFKKIKTITETKNMEILIENKKNGVYSVGFEEKTIELLNKLNTNVLIDIKND